MQRADIISLHIEDYGPGRALLVSSKYKCLQTLMYFMNLGIAHKDKNLLPRFRRVLDQMPFDVQQSGIALQNVPGEQLSEQLRDAMPRVLALRLT